MKEGWLSVSKAGVVDFCCPQEMLIIELDGNVHGRYDQIVKDEIRDNYLKKLGFIVIRFENKHVFQDPEFVISEIRKCLPEKQEIPLITNQPPRHSFVVPPLLQKEGRV